MAPMDAGGHTLDAGARRLLGVAGRAGGAFHEACTTLAGDPGYARWLDTLDAGARRGLFQPRPALASCLADMAGPGRDRLMALARHARRRRLALKGPALG